MWSAIVVPIIVSVCIGVINGFFVVKVGVNSFIATLGMATVIGAFQTIVSGNNLPLIPASATWTALTTTTVFGFQIIVLYLVAFAVLVRQ